MNDKGDRELVLGPFRPVLEAALAERIQRAKSDDPGAPVIVLVGSNVLALYLRRLVAVQTALWNVRFFTFAELARLLGAGPMSARGRRPLPAIAAKTLLRHIIRERALAYFEPVAELPGFVRTVAASIDDLKNAGIGPATLRKMKGPKHEAFARVFEDYERALDRLGFYDGGDLAAATAEAAAGADLLRSATFIAYGFYDLTGVQRRLVLAAAEAARSTAVMVPYEDAPAYEYAWSLVRWLADEGFTAQAAKAKAGSLAERLFAAPDGSQLGAHGLKIVSVPGDSREAGEVVREVLDFARLGIPFHQIAVLLRNPETYSRPIRDAFELRGIPYFMSHGRPLAETVEARSLLLLAELLASDLPRADVMQFVHFAPIAFERLIGCAPNTADWELLSIRAGIVSGADEWRDRLARLAAPRDAEDEAEPPDLAAELPRLRGFIEHLIKARESVPAAGNWTSIVGALVQVYEDLLIPSELRERVAAAVRQLGELDRLGSETTFDEVRDAVGDLIEAERLAPQGFQRGKVYIGGLFESRGLGFRAVIVPGLVEKGFPTVGRQDPILLDGERGELARLAGPSVYLPAKGARPAEERILFLLALSSAAERTTLTFPRLDPATARERIPSHFLMRLVEASSGTRCDYSSLEQAQCFVRVPMFAATTDPERALDLDEYDLQSVAAFVAAGEPAQGLYLAKVSGLFARGVEAETARWQQRTFTKFDGMVPAAGHAILMEGVLSPTRLERYATCPFQYFLERVLGLRVIEEPEVLERLSPLDRGSVIHRVLCRAYSECFGTPGTVSAEALGAALRDAAEAEFRRLGAVGHPLTWALDRGEILADLARFAVLDADDCRASAARPLWFETRFGMPPRGGDESPASTEKPLELRAGKKVYRFKGKIDRIDEVGAADARVIDYKSGARQGKANMFEGGRALQLPLYLLATQMLLPKRRVTRAEYSFATGRGGFGSVAFDRETLDARMSELQEILRCIEDGIERGVFIAAPAGRGCTWCDFADICGANKETLFDRKKDAPAIADLTRMWQIE